MGVEKLKKDSMLYLANNNKTQQALLLMDKDS